MLLFTCEGPRSIDERDVIYVYRAETMGRYCSATIVLADGRELSGLALVTALDALPRSASRLPTTGLYATRDRIECSWRRLRSAAYLL